MIYLFKAPPNGTPTLDTRSVRKNTSKNTYPITSHHILPRNSFQVGTPCWYKYPVSRAPWGESTVTYRKAYARLKNWMPLGWPYHARHAAALAAQNFVDFKVVATGAAVVGTEDNCSERAAKIWSNSRSWGTKDKAFKTPTATKPTTSASTPKRGAISRPASNGATVLLIRSICDISEFVLCNRSMEKSLGDQSRFTVTSLRVVPSCSTTLQLMKAHTAGRLDLYAQGQTAIQQLRPQLLHPALPHQWWPQNVDCCGLPMNPVAALAAMLQVPWQHPNRQDLLGCEA